MTKGVLLDNGTSMETHLVCDTSGRASLTEVEQGAILVVEDPFIRKYLRDLLVRHGFRVVGSDVPAAAAMLSTGAEQVDLIITNSPKDFLRFRDQVPLLYIAAAPDPELAARFSWCRTLAKPFQPADLVAAVRDLTAAAV